MSLPSTLFEALANESLNLRQLPGLQVGLVFTAYTEEHKKISVRPVADICYFTNTNTVETLAKNKDTVAILDNHCLETFDPLLDKLSENMQFEAARAVAIRFVVALVRAAIGKGSKELGFPVGKIGAMPWGEEKIMAIKKSWTTWVERDHPSAKGLKLALGFKDDDPDQDQDEDTE